jgi:S-adenosylmethionine:tRNA ribosyltransferase-isomerase
MHLNEFDFELPPHLIARYPLPQRSASRLLCLDKERGNIQHRRFIEIIDLITPQDLLVFNDTRVIPARWFGYKDTGGRVEVLVERIINERQFWAHIGCSKSPKIPSYLYLNPNIPIQVLAKQEDLYLLQCGQDHIIYALLEEFGNVPLPPYLQRQAEDADKERYQTVYASKNGAVAAPTAGLHFDASLLEKIQQRKIPTAFLTLHVGAGTFQPVRAKKIEDHIIHSEYVEVNAAVCAEVKAARQRGGRVIAVGTTTVRALETAANWGEGCNDFAIQPFIGDSNLFIYPGYSFRCVDALITNFHLPKSSLLMLVSAFGGYASVMQAYQSAIAENYRFYSYGDAMWIG